MMQFCDGEYNKNVIENRLKFMKVGEEPVEKKGLEKKLSTKLGSNLSIIMAGMKKKGS
jgi:hypothetical protein|tara:strand:+ start:255 stop:428 length:174 start_codon:yes stop_codon:yes gene_type:complete